MSVAGPKHPGRSVSAARLSRRVAFAGAAFSLAVIFAASGSPIPLYARYRATDHFTSSDVSLTAVAYFAAAVTALLVLARLSDHVGRRPVTIAALLLAGMGCLALVDVHSLGSLITGRVCQGLACGLASSGLAAYVVDLAPARPAWLAAAVTATGPMIGLTLGALLSGALAAYEHTLSGAYLIITGLLVLGVILTTLSPDTVRLGPGAVASLAPQVRVPKASRSLLPVAAAVFVATWALGGFYQAFSPLLAADRLGTTNTVVTAAIFASYMVPSIVGSPLAGRLTTAVAQRVGMIVFFAGAAGLLLALHAGSIGIFLLAGVIAGFAQAIAYTGSLRGLVGTARREERAGLLSAIFLISYTGAAVPGFIAGRLSSLLDLTQILAGYAGLAGIACVVVLVAARNPSTTRKDTDHDADQRDRPDRDTGAVRRAEAHR